MQAFKEWEGFAPGPWQQRIDTRDFILRNYRPYENDESFLAPVTARTKALSAKVFDLLRQERDAGGVLDVDVEHVSSILAYKPAYVDKDLELIVGLQTEKPLCRAINPFGGLRMAIKACEAYGYTLSQKVRDAFEYRTTHNDGVFHIYTDEMRRARKAGIITGLPDAYGRGRIIGDYRRLALYGMDAIIAEKQEDKRRLGELYMSEENIRLIEELYKQLDFLEKLKTLAEWYGFDLSQPAKNAREAVQWLYFAYLGAVREQNGAAMSLGRISAFLDIYFERDIAAGHLNEAGAQELIDDLVLKLRMVRHLRTPEYNELFAGDPNWITVAEGGMSEDGRTLVTKTDYRMLQTLYHLGPAPEPNITVLWSQALPAPFKSFCAKVSMDTDSIQYENDDLMRPEYGDDYAIACCVSAMRMGKQMQYFGARANIAKLLLLALNGGRDEISGLQIGPKEPAVGPEELDYKQVRERFDRYCAWLCRLYVNTLNIIHYMHDKYAYERLEMGFHDTMVDRMMAFGIAGLSVAADSLSAIKYARVTPVFDERGLVTDFITIGDYPRYGNDDDRADDLAKELAENFISQLRQTPAYRGARHTLSVLTITSNIVYGKKTGSTPDGRKKGEPFAPGANPMHGRDVCGALASLNSVAKIPYESCQDGISCTFTVLPSAIGKQDAERQDNLVSVLDGYFAQNGHHLNVNVLNRETLLRAMEDPEAYPNLTIRVSGYAVNFHRLSREQQTEVIRRTMHNTL